MQEFLKELSDNEQREFRDLQAKLTSGGIVTYEGRTATSVNELVEVFRAHKNTKWNEADSVRALATASGIQGAGIIEPIVQALMVKAFEPVAEQLRINSEAVAALKQGSVATAGTAKVDNAALAKSVEGIVAAKLKPIADELIAATAALKDATAALITARANVVAVQPPTTA